MTRFFKQYNIAGILSVTVFSRFVEHIVKKGQIF